EYSCADRIHRELAVGDTYLLIVPENTDIVWRRCPTKLHLHCHRTIVAAVKAMEFNCYWRRGYRERGCREWLPGDNTFSGILPHQIDRRQAAAAATPSTVAHSLQRHFRRVAILQGQRLDLPVPRASGWWRRGL